MSGTSRRDTGSESRRTPGCRATTARGLNHLGNLLADVGRDAEAEQAYGRALDVRKALVADFPGVPTGGAVVVNNLAEEVLTWLDLQPGVYRMVVNGDNGFKVPSLS